MMDMRSMASSQNSFSKLPKWSAFTISMAVKEGMKINPWVYQSVNKIAKAISSVRLHVQDSEGVEIKGHYLSKAFQSGQSQYSYQDTLELISAWLDLAGVAYLYKIKTGKKTTGFNPVSPDRLAPIEADDADLFREISGYAVKSRTGAVTSSSAVFTPNSIISFRNMNPASPIEGLPPLQAIARIVDAANYALDWNVKVLENDGRLPGLLSFAQRLDKVQIKGIIESIREKFGARRSREPLIIGDSAEYTPISATAAEMDYLNSIKFYRDSIFAFYGIPPQLAGSLESSTYNNFAVSLAIFWASTICPKLDDICSSLTKALSDELGDAKIGYNMGELRAKLPVDSSLFDSVKTLSESGIPMQQIAKILSIGVSEYDGWDKPKQTPNVAVSMSNTRAKTRLTAYRHIRGELDALESYETDTIEPIYRAYFKECEKILDDAVAVSMDAAENTLPAQIQDLRGKYVKKLTAATAELAKIMGGFVIINKRDIEDDIIAAIEEYLQQEAVLLRDFSHIEATTVDTMIAQVRDAAYSAATAQELKSAIQDSGVLSPSRSLQLARTTGGSAMSIGQYFSAKAGGAKKKTWRASGGPVRGIHAERDGETVDMDAHFSARSGSYGPRWPLDVNLPPADRVNCRCSMTFSSKEG